jgi:hypothetical protein
MREVTIQEILPTGAIKIIKEQRDENDQYIPGTRHIRFVVGEKKKEELKRGHI